MTIPIPPRDLVVDALLHVVLPPTVTMLVVLVVGLLLLPKKHAGWLALVGLLLGWWVGNYFRDVVPWWPMETSWTKKYEVPTGNNKRLEWLPWLTVAAGVVGTVFARRPTWGWAALLVLLAFALPRVVPNKFVLEPWWLVPAWAATMVLAVGVFPQQHTTAPSIAHPFAMLIAVGTTGMIALHAHSARLMDAMMLLHSGLAVALIVAAISRSDIGLTLAPCAFAVVAMVLMMFQETSSELPWFVFALPALSLAGAALIPGENRYMPWLRFLLIAGACGFALYTAHDIEPLDFENL